MTDTLSRPTEKPPMQRQRERIFALCGKLRISRGDRLEIAAYVLGREVETFNQLGPVELSRLVDGFETTYYAMALLMERQRGLRF